MRIGIYGGTFNPIHNAHLCVARTALEALDLSRVIFVPAGTPPLKGSRQLIDGRQRLAMVRAAIAGNPAFSAIDFEIEREGKSFTIDTVRHLAGQYPPDAELFFILGDDCAAKLHHWKGIDELCRLVRFACISRTGVPLPAATPPLQMIAMPAMDISSSRLRERLRDGQPVRDLTPAAVADHIDRHHLYRAAETGTPEFVRHA
jgi:nicotinate-nucleotide adenylyltransferase